MTRSRATRGVLSCAALAAGLGGCGSMAQHSARDTEFAAPPTSRSVGLVAGDSIGRFSFADDRRIAWAPDLPWTASYRSVVEQDRARATATVHVDPDSR